MTSADFSDPISSPLDDDSTKAKSESSPGNSLTPSHLYLPHLQLCFPGKYRTFEIIDSSSSIAAFYVISVRQVSALPSASFRFHLTVDTLAVQLMIPLTGLIGDLHSQVSAPCRAHNKKATPINIGVALKWIPPARVGWR